MVVTRPGKRTRRPDQRTCVRSWPSRRQNCTHVAASARACSYDRRMDPWTPEDEARHVAEQAAADARATRWLIRIGIAVVVILLAWIAAVVASFGS